MKPKSSTDFASLPDKEVPRYTEIWATEISRILTRGLDFQSNFDASTVEATFLAANTDTIISHGLKRAPVGYIVTASNAAMAVYSGSGVTDDQVISLKSSSAGTATILFF